MISIVCVYNNEVTLKNILLKGLENQTAQFELITLDNRDKKYKSAAAAFNYGGEKVKGDYIMFVHQDMWLGSKSWLEETERTLESIAGLGVAGVAGQVEEGKTWEERCRYSIEVFGDILGDTVPATKPEEVQTLDECLLIVPRKVFERLKFDEKTFDGWDCYGADYCLAARQLGLKAYVIPGYCSHSCLRANFQYTEFGELLKYQKQLYKKYKRDYKKIYLWMGVLSKTDIWLRQIMQYFSVLYFRLFPDFNVILRRELSGCNTVLDLGCGYLSPINRYNLLFSVGVELYEPYLQESSRKRVHDQYIKADVRIIEFKPKSFDAVIALDLLEHLTKQEGADLLHRMEMWARKKVIVFTPNGYIRQGEYDNNPLQEHKASWDTGELRNAGFQVKGILGWKALRGNKARIKYKPVFLWTRISDLTQKITYRWPTLAFHLFAVKQIKEPNKK
jgi:GT2 family glycosyltransferase